MARILTAWPTRHPDRLQSRFARCVPFLRSCWIAISTFGNNRAAIAQLSAMSDQELQDIGIARCEIVALVTGMGPCETRRKAFPDMRRARRPVRRRDGVH